MMERFKNTTRYEGYMVSNKGRVFSKKTNTFLKQIPNYKGYYRVVLCVNGKPKNVAVHRLVAEAFIDNPHNCPIINHKDENKQNNNVENLEWCTHLYNSNYGNCQLNKARKIKKAVLQLNPKTDEIISQFESLKEAEENGYNHSNVSACCNGRKKTAYGYKWKYVMGV